MDRIGQLRIDSIERRPADGMAACRRYTWDGWLWLGALLLVNSGLLLGRGPAAALAFDPGRVAAGEWWRLLSWTLVHVSPYHLLLDGSAFLLLYLGLEEKQAGRKLLLVAASALGALLLPVLMDGRLRQVGLCGLSGVAHGLAVISALEMLHHRSQKTLGRLLLGGLALKLAWELGSGQVLLQGLHLGDIGLPIVATHVGGALGGLLGYAGLKSGLNPLWRRRRHG